MKRLSRRILHSVSCSCFCADLVVIPEGNLRLFFLFPVLTPAQQPYFSLSGTSGGA
jgi:hypothetical protein